MGSDLLAPSELPESRRAIVPSWIVSAIVHATVLLLVGMLWQFAPEGIVEEPDRATGIVITKHTPQGDFFEDADNTFAPESGGATSTSPPRKELPNETAPVPDLTGAIPLPPTVGGGGLDGTGPGVGNDPTKGPGGVRLPGGKVRTSIFGVSGEGSQFVYVFDRSESMYGRQLEMAKKELIASLGHLDRQQQFGIVFYNHEASIFNPDRLLRGDDAGKNRAGRFIRGITAAGATNHFPAIMFALRKFSPDVIFLLTDGERHNDPSPDELRRIRRANSGAQIHVIQFVQGTVSTRGNKLVQLARENGGQHKFVNTWKLK